VVMLIHLALGRKTRERQFGYICDVVNAYRHVIVMGDMNCAPDSPEMRSLFRNTDLREPLDVLHTFPSWRPNRHIDHILVTPGIAVTACHVLNHAFSDHLPIAMEVQLPADVALPA
jgi:endonuclease/exonuclease/phosphatase family metal-dependent hydrolase